MGRYFVYHCSVSVIDTDENTVTSVLEAHTDDSKIHMDKEGAVCELREIIDKHCKLPLQSKIKRLNRVVAVLDKKVTNAVTVPV